MRLVRQCRDVLRFQRADRQRDLLQRWLFLRQRTLHQSGRIDNNDTAFDL